MTWVGATAGSIARAVRRGDTSAGEVVDAHIRHIRAVDHELGAFQVVRTVPALAEAEIVDELPDLAGLSLAGVPITVSESAAVAGERTRLGSPATTLPVAEADHEVVRRLRGAGAVVVGMTRMSELGIFGFTDDDDVITRNPWRMDRTPGGSAGGAAAAVAAGMVPLAQATDAFGGIRAAAACCGLVGLKPGRGIVPTGGSDWFELSENGVLATTVFDAALGFAVMAGRRPRPPESPKPLSIAVSLRSPAQGVSPDRDCRLALARVTRLLVDAGHSARRADPTYPPRMSSAEITHWFAGAYQEAVRFDRSELQPRTRRHIALGEWVASSGLVRTADREQWRDHYLNWLTDHRFDVMMTPALAGPPPPAERWSRRGWLANVTASVRYAPYCAPWNFAGLPALVVPAGIRRDGLPVGVQLVGPPGSEELLLGLAAVIEEAAPWHRHAPGWPRLSRITANI